MSVKNPPKNNLPAVETCHYVSFVFILLTGLVSLLFPLFRTVGPSAHLGAGEVRPLTLTLTLRFKKTADR